MPGYSAADFVADQLKAAAPEAEWNAAGIDRAHELALILLRNGIIDLSQLGLIAVKVTPEHQLWEHPEATDALAFVYEGRQIGFMGTPDRIDRDEFLQGTLCAWSAAGHGNVGYDVVPSSRTGFKIVPHWASSSDAAEIRTVVKFFASIMVSFALPAAGIAVTQSIGAAVLGPTLAASYPALASAIGSVAISTAFNGGDIESAVKGAALSYVGGEAGQTVGSFAAAASDAEVIGKVAEACTRALISGGNVQQAAAVALLQNGGAVYDAVAGNDTASLQSDIATRPIKTEVAPMDTFDAGNGTYISVDPSPDAPFEPIAPISDGVSALPSFPDIVQTSDLQPLSVPNGGSSSIVPAMGIGMLTAAPATEPPISATDPNPPTSAREVVQTISQAALAALQLTAAYRALNGKVGVNTQARAVTPSGAVVALDSGVVQSRDAAGRIVNNRPPVGVPQSTVTGNITVNNGDGTYTLISPSGQRRVIQYGANTGADSIFSSMAGWNWPIILGVGGLAVALLRKR